MQRAKPVTVKVLVLILATLAITAVVTVQFGGDRGVALAQPAPAFAINPTPPTELNAAGGGPAQATLQQAAEFAWQEFFALNWPAGLQPAKRDTPSATCVFGDQSANCAGPLVWQTFRNKVEVFPGSGEPPGYSATAPSFGYDAPPEYNYGPLHSVVACSTTPLPSTAWVNLDETDQIGVNSMYAGIVSVPATPFNPTSLFNTAPQLVRFLAKVNRAEYEYVAGHKWWSGNAPKAATATYVKTNMKDPPNGDDYVLLPNNSIEVKSGWRVLNPDEMTSGKFHMQTVRYYEKNSSNVICYQQATFGLVALHIIQKTALAPYFIFASFEQADNILDASGKPVEDAEGNVRSQLPPCRADQDPKQPCPTTPSVTLNDTPVVSSPQIPPEVVLVPPTAAYCTASTDTPPPNQLFYLDTSGLLALPTDGYICVNKRDNDIPPAVVDTNTKAHALIQDYSAAHGVKNSVWQYYKLVNVQYQPINKDHPTPYGTEPGEKDFLTGHNPSSYYMANIVVETNRPLQMFSGSLVAGATTGSNSDYDSQFGGPAGTAIHHNMFYQGSGYNMGGCMGCHGAQGQSQGGDFSVLLARGRVQIAETPAVPTKNGATRVLRNRELK